MNISEAKQNTIWTKGFTCITISNMFMSLAIFSVSTYITTYMGFLGLGAEIAGLIAGSFYCIAFILRPISGPAITILNKKRLAIVVFASGAIINLGYAFFTDVSLFIAVRLLNGVQMAFFGSLGLTIATDSLPEEKMASGIGVYGLTGIVAQAIGPTIAVFVQGLGQRIGGESGGFKATFLTAALFSLFAVIPSLILPDHKISKEDAKTLGKWYRNIVAKESIASSVVITCLSMATILFNTYMIPYGEWKGINNISLFFIINAAVTVAARPIAGKLTDKYGPAKIFFPGVLLYMSSFIAVSIATDIKLIIVGALCASLGFGAALPAVQSMAVQSVTPLKRGVASNTVFFGMDLGNFLGPTLAGLVLAQFNYATLFRFAIIPLMISIVIFALGWRPYVKQREVLTQIEGGSIENIQA